jgi:hypothetical protein
MVAGVYEPPPRSRLGAIAPSPCGEVWKEPTGPREAGVVGGTSPSIYSHPMNGMVRNRLGFPHRIHSANDRSHAFIFDCMNFLLDKLLCMSLINVIYLFHLHNRIDLLRINKFNFDRTIA